MLTLRKSMNQYYSEAEAAHALNVSPWTRSAIYWTSISSTRRIPARQCWNLLMPNYFCFRSGRSLSAQATCLQCLRNPEAARDHF